MSLKVVMFNVVKKFKCEVMFDFFFFNVDLKMDVNWL